LADRGAASGTRPFPGDGELVGVLKQSIQDVFSMMACSIEDAALRRDGPEAPAAGGSDDDDPSPYDLEAVIGFHGRMDGYVVLRCSAQGARDVAHRLLMRDAGETLPLEEVLDALGECVNMVAGSLKTKALDPIDEFRLGLPEIHETPPATGDYRCGSLAYRLADGVIAAELWIAERDA
jgi:hypothetical protein